MSEFFFKSANIWQSDKQERDCLVHFLRRVGQAREVHEMAITKYAA